LWGDQKLKKNRENKLPGPVPNPQKKSSKEGETGHPQILCLMKKITKEKGGGGGHEKIKGLKPWKNTKKEFVKSIPYSIPFGKKQTRDSGG